MVVHFNELRRLSYEIRRAINDLCTMDVPRGAIYVAMPSYLSMAFGHYDQIMFDALLPPKIKYLYGCKVIPNHENNVAVFYEDCQLHGIPPILIQINKHQ